MAESKKLIQFFDLNKEDDEEDSSGAWERVKWTKDMVKLLITAVSYTVKGTTSGAETTNLFRKGKWRAISNAMVERGFKASPQQCEDKFNDLNKKYRRLNELLGKGTSCKVVEDPSLLDMMDLPSAVEKEVMKLLGCKQLFYQELCSYNNGNRLFLPDDWALYESLGLSKRGKYYDGDAQSDDGYRAKRKKQVEELDFGGFNSGPSLNELVTSRLMNLQEQKLQIEKKMLELEKTRLEWMKINQREDRKLEKIRQENERLKLENMHLEAEIKCREAGADLN